MKYDNEIAQQKLPYCEFFGAMYKCKEYPFLRDWKV